MTTHQLSRSDARRIAVQAQLLASPRPTDLLDVVRRLTLLQYSATKAVAPSADLVAWSRLGSAYDPAELEDALAGGALVEYRGMIRPCEDIALYRADMEAWEDGTPGVDGWRTSNREWVRANDACRRDILARLEADGPTAARDLPDTCEVPWRSSGWNDDRNVRILLEFMELRGEVAVAGRVKGQRVWELASRVYPDDPSVPAEEAARREAPLGLLRVADPVRRSAGRQGRRNRRP